MASILLLRTDQFFRLFSHSLGRLRPISRLNANGSDGRIPDLRGDPPRATRLRPLRSTGGPISSTVPEMPSAELAEEAVGRFEELASIDGHVAAMSSIA